MTLGVAKADCQCPPEIYRSAYKCVKKTGLLHGK